MRTDELQAKEEAARLAVEDGAPMDPKSKVGVAAKQAQQKK
jgi:hypothetical protein